MKSKDFLRSKGILSNDSHHFIIDFHDGREINLGDLLEEYAQQSQPSGMRWVREKPANDREFVLVTASLINGEWHYHGWEIIEVPDGYFALCELHGEEWGPYEDLSAEYYLVLSPVSESSPAGAAEGASEGMAEALRLKWINLTEDMGRLLSGQRGVSIDKLNKAMNLVQEFVNTLPASLSSPGSGWVSVEDAKPNGRLCAVLVCNNWAPEHKRCTRTAIWFGQTNKFFMDCDNAFTAHEISHWQPLPAPPGE